jgi:serine/threonine protein kinase/WD40 repeat protein
MTPHDPVPVSPSGDPTRPAPTEDAVRSAAERDPFDELAEEFVERLRRGEHPALSEFTARRPDLADRIRHLFPTLVLMERAVPTSDASAPERLGEYRLVRELGRGGMGVVHEAVQESLGRRVALKVLPADRCRGVWLERFRREAQAAARLHHTNIVPVFGVGQDNDTHFYVMQYIDGHGLDRVLFEVRRVRDSSARPASDGPSALAQSLLAGRLTVDATVEPTDGAGAPAAPVTHLLPDGEGYFRAIARIGRQAADALHYAHTQGVLHRDIKPSNLLLDSRGSVWVTDFGLAKSIRGVATPDGPTGAEPQSLTETGDFIGTLRYMAPERFRGECDARSDVYALGATLYELLALRPAFDDPDRLRLIHLIARGDPEPPRRLNPAVPRDLDTIVRKATARRPADRYPTAAALADDLTRFAEGRPVRARRTSAPELAWRWARRRPGVAALSAAVVLLTVAAAAGGWWAAGALRQQVNEVTGAKRELTERLWEARAAQARAVRVSRLPGQRLRGLEAVAEAAAIRPDPELRNEACACLALHDLRVEREWDETIETTRLEYSTGVAFDPDLTHYAFADTAGGVSVRTAEGRTSARLEGHKGPADYLRFSPDGRYLVARFTTPLPQRRPLRVWDWRSGRIVLDLPNVPQMMLSFDFHPSGTAMAVGAARRVDCYALPGGEKVREIPLGFAPGWLAFEPVRGELLAVAGENRLRVAPWRGGAAVAEWSGLPTGLYAVAWRPGGGFLAASGRDGNVYTFDPVSGARGAVLQGHQFEARELAFTPDGTVLLSRGWDATTRLWDPVEGRELLRVRGASFVQVSRDGRRIAYRGYTTARLGVWELVGGDVCRVLYAPGGLTPMARAALSFSPDGAVLAGGGASGLTLWDVRTGETKAHERVGGLSDVRFDPRGRWLFAGGPDARSYRFGLGRDGAGGCQLGERSAWPANVSQPFQYATDRTGDVVAVVDRFRHVLVTHLDPAAGFREAGPPQRLEGPLGVSFTALSPDGRWAAAGPWRSNLQPGSQPSPTRGVRVWRVSDGKLERELPSDETAGVTFAPDGRLMVLEGDGSYRVYAPDTFERQVERTDPLAGYTRGLRVAFHPDGRTIAHAHDRIGLRLSDLETGEPLVVLTVPDSHNLAAYEFSPDGRYVAAVTVRGAVQVWDLVRLRGVLRELGLDWSLRGDRAGGDR